MTVQFDPYTWANGQGGATPITAERGPQRWEAALANLANAINDAEDSVEALVASTSNARAVKIQSGTTTDRALVQPALGAVFLDTTLGYPVWGDGTSWKKFTDNSALSSAGGTNAPQNFTAVTQPDNSIVCTWTAVAGATSYKLYETASPTGVSGATALTGTTTTRTPSTNRTYEYWLTATVSGVESAASNHAQATIPYVAPGGGGGTGTGSPAAFLGLNTAGHGYWDLGIGYSTGHVNTPPSQLTSGFSVAPYFVMNSTNDAVQFQIYANGATTSANTHYPRSELREYKSDGTTKAAWTAGSGSHIMQYDMRVLHLPPNKPWVTVGQIHDADSDALSIKVKGNSTAALDIVASIYDTDNGTKLISGYTLNTWVTIKIDLTSGSLKLYSNGTQKITSSAMSGKGSGHYFKLGNYLQTADDYGGFESPSEYGLVEIKNLTVTHSPAL